VTGFAFLPIAGGIAVAANLSTIVLMPRVGPKPLVAVGMLAAAGAMTWLAQLGVHTSYVSDVLGPLILAGAGVGMVIAPSRAARSSAAPCCAPGPLYRKDGQAQPDARVMTAETKAGPALPG
jgi:hypothetical protein